MSCKWHFSDSELTIKKGDLVVVLDKSDKDRWKGVVHETEGFFPCRIANEILNSSASSPQPLSDEATAKEPVIVNQPTTTASGDAEVPRLREVAEAKDGRGQATTSSHATDELKVVDLAEGKDNLEPSSTDSHATEVPMELTQVNVDQGQVKTQATTLSHATDELKVLDRAERNDNLHDSHATEVPMELAKVNVDQGQVKTHATTSSHATDELKVLDLAEGKDNLDQPTTDSHATEVQMDLAQVIVDEGQGTTASRATEGSTLLKLAEAKDDVATEVSSASSDKTGNLHDPAGLLAVTG